MRFCEIHDQSWFPKALRDQITDDLQLVLEVTKIYRPIAKSVASKALKGNVSAAAEAANRAEGTPRQRREESEKGPRELVIRVIEDKPTQRAKLNAEQAADLLPPDGDSGPE